MEIKPPTSLKIFGWLSSVFTALGMVFKFNHWPGASVAFLIGSISLLFFYLPLWFVNQEKKGRLFIVIWQFFTLFFTGLTFLVKTMHWPFGGILYTGWLMYVMLFILPFSFYLLFKAGKKTLVDFHLVVVFFLLCSIIIGGVTGGISRGNFIASSFSKTTVQIKNSVERLITKNKQLYEAFNHLPDKVQNPFYQKTLILKNLTDSTVGYLRNFRNNMISLSEQVSAIKADSMDIEDLRDMTNSTAPTEISGYGSSPETGKFTANELKKILESYKARALDLANSDNKNFIKTGINLDTEPTKDQDGEMTEWEFATFRNIPVSAALLTVENIHYEIKNAETQVLADLLNSTKQNSDDLASKVAELGTKLETERKQFEIDNLKTERELSMANMAAKNSELDAQQQTIAVFIFGLLGCSVLIFFIIRSNMMRKKINLELNAQKQLIETKNKEITDSINYARRIQSAILPPIDAIYSTLTDSFLLYKPKDVVSGDFYGFIKRENYVLIAIADCTGHGVPGAFMSMIGNEQLSKIINERGITKPSEILNELHRGVRSALKQDHANGETRDGMDIAICKLYLDEKKLEYSGAMRPLWIMRKGELIETKADKQPIGGLEADYRKPFTNHEIQLEDKDSLYLFTDGYADQFGGEKGKKYMLKNFERLLLEINSMNMQQQASIINQKFEAWKGGHEQVDDVLVLGIRV